LNPRAKGRRKRIRVNRKRRCRTKECMQFQKEGGTLECTTPQKGSTGGGNFRIRDSSRPRNLKERCAPPNGKTKHGCKRKSVNEGKS